MPRYLDILGDDLGTDGAPLMNDRRTGDGADAHIGIEDQVALNRGGEDKPFDKFDGKLAGVDRLLDVVRFNVREHPYVARILAKGIPRVFPDPSPLPGSLPRVLLGNSDRVKVEDVGVTLCEPQDHLVPPGETSIAVQSMLEVPDDAISESQGWVTHKGWIKKDVDRQDASVNNVVPDLPAEATTRPKYPHTLGDDSHLASQILLRRQPLLSLVLLRDVVGR